MGVHVVDLVRIQAGIAQSIVHAAGGALPVLRRLGHMMSVTAHTVADQLGINGSAAGSGVLVFLQHHNPRAVAQHKAVAVPVPGPAGGFRIVVAGR